jgi:hypothetical protein
MLGSKLGPSDYKFPIKVEAWHYKDNGSHKFKSEVTINFEDIITEDKNKRKWELTNKKKNKSGG